jgi:hypothetical protein
MPNLEDHSIPSWSMTRFTYSGNRKRLRQEEREHDYCPWNIDRIKAKILKKCTVECIPSIHPTPWRLALQMILFQRKLWTAHLLWTREPGHFDGLEIIDAMSLLRKALTVNTKIRKLGAFKITYFIFIFIA